MLIILPQLFVLHQLNQGVYLLEILQAISFSVWVARDFTSYSSPLKSSWMQYGDMALVLDLLGEVEEIVNFR
jgi:hypothetical protein